MKITTTSRHYELTPDLKEYAESKIEHLTTFFDNIVSAHVVFALEKYRHFVEVTLHVNGKDMVAHNESEDMYLSVDRVAEKLARQIRKYKGKLYNKKAPGLGELGAEVVEQEPPSQPDQLIIEDKRVVPADPIEFPQLTLNEAVRSLNDNGREFDIFSNSVTKRLNVLFKREDGSIGLIEA